MPEHQATADRPPSGLEPVVWVALLRQDSWADLVAGILAWAARLHSGLEAVALPVAGTVAVAVVAGWAAVAQATVIVTEEEIVTVVIVIAVLAEDEEVAAPAGQHEMLTTEADEEERVTKTTRTKAPIGRGIRVHPVHAPVARAPDLDPVVETATAYELAPETVMQTRIKTNRATKGETKAGTRSATAAAIETVAETEVAVIGNAHATGNAEVPAEAAETESVADLVLVIATLESAGTGTLEQPEVAAAVAAANRESVGVKVGNRYKLPSRLANNYYKSDWISSISHGCCS